MERPRIFVVRVHLGMVVVGQVGLHGNNHLRHRVADLLLAVAEVVALALQALPQVAQQPLGRIVFFEELCRLRVDSTLRLDIVVTLFV